MAWRNTYDYRYCVLSEVKFILLCRGGVLQRCSRQLWSGAQKKTACITNSVVGGSSQHTVCSSITGPGTRQLFLAILACRDTRPSRLHGGHMPVVRHGVSSKAPDKESSPAALASWELSGRGLAPRNDAIARLDEVSRWTSSYLGHFCTLGLRIRRTVTGTGSNKLQDSVSHRQVLSWRCPAAHIPRCGCSGQVC